MEGRGVEWSREILLSLGEALAILDEIERRGLRPGDTSLLKRILTEVYGSIEEGEDIEEYPWYLGEDL